MSFEWLFVRPDGDERATEVTLTLVPLDGRREMLLCTVRVLTDEKRTSQVLKREREDVSGLFSKRYGRDDSGYPEGEFYRKDGPTHSVSINASLVHHGS